MPADTFAPPPVLICSKCQRGFLTAQPRNIDQYPLWKVLSSKDEGPVCGGEIRQQQRAGGYAENRA